nr:ead/Ea22-like family protein [Klebsiella grimontii]
MTTDITELAQSLKAAAENAIGAHERLAAYPYGEIIDISQHEGEQIDIDITDLNEFHEEASPVNVLALVEALEHYKSREARVTNLVLDNSKSWNELYQQVEAKDKRNAELVEALEKAQQKADVYNMLREDYNLRGKGIGLANFVDWQAKRIAELESRTLTDWIEHDGKWRPESLGLGELVYLKTRKQELKIPYPAGKVKGWMHTGGDMDVMAYKLASPQSSTVTVKLPRPGFVTISGERMAVYLKADVDAALAAAGIREAE